MLIGVTTRFGRHFDMPGVDAESINVSIEQDVLRVHANRRWAPNEGDELYARERAQGELSRQVMLGKAVDTTNVTARYYNGVLAVQLPIAQASRATRPPLRISPRCPLP